MKAGAAVGAATRLMRGPNQHAELLSTPRVGRGGPTLPRVESASGDAEYLTEVRERHAGLLRLDERESYSLSLAKKAAAFFRTSRSTRRRRFSLRSRRSLFSFFRRQARAPLCSIRTSPLDPVAQRGLREIEITSHLPHAPAFVEYQAHRSGLELVIKLPAWAPILGWLHHRGHRIRLSECVHEIGSSPTHRLKSAG